MATEVMSDADIAEKYRASFARLAELQKKVSDQQAALKARQKEDLAEIRQLQKGLKMFAG